MEKIGFRIPLLLSAGLYCFSLALPIYAPKPDLVGAYGLLGGWMVVMNDLATWVSWFANVTFFIALWNILKRKEPKPMRALIFSVLSLVLGLAILGAGTAVAGASEELGKMPMGYAFYAWIGSFVLLILASWIKYKKS